MANVNPNALPLNNGMVHNVCVGMVMLDIQVYVECVLRGQGLMLGGCASVREAISTLMFKDLSADSVDLINKLMKGELGALVPLDLSAGRGGVLLIVLILKF